MIRTQIQLTEEQDRALEELSAARRLSKAELVRQAVDLLLGQGVPERSPAERRRRAIAVAGRFHSGHGTVARDHDAQLAEAYE